MADVTGVTIDLTSIVAPILLSVLTGAIGFVGTYLSRFLKSKLNASQLELLESIAANVVLAVEQNSLGKEVVKSGLDKKAEAEERIAELLKKYSINLSAEAIDTAIESAVGNVLNANEIVAPPKMIEVQASEGDGFSG